MAEDRKTLNNVKRKRPEREVPKSGLNVLGEDFEEPLLTGGGAGTFAYSRHPELGGVAAGDPEGVDLALQRLALQPERVQEIGTFADVLNPETGAIETKELDRRQELIPGDLQVYIDNPELARIEQAIAITRTMDPNDERLTPQQAREVRQANELVQAYAAPGPRPTGPMLQIPGEEERQQFIDFVVQRQFGGQDPRQANAVQEANVLDESYFEQAYETARQQSGGGLVWETLTEPQRAKIRQQMQSNYIDWRRPQIDQQVQMLEGLIGRYETERDKKIKNIEIGKRRVKEAAAASAKFRRGAQKRVLELQKEESQAYSDLVKAQAEAVQASGTPEIKEAAQARVEQIRNRISDIQQQKAQARKDATLETAPRAEGAPAGLEGEPVTETFEEAEETPKATTRGLKVERAFNLDDLNPRDSDQQLKPVTDDIRDQVWQSIQAKYPDASIQEKEARAITALRNMGYNPFPAGEQQQLTTEGPAAEALAMGD